MSNAVWDGMYGYWVMHDDVDEHGAVFNDEVLRLRAHNMMYTYNVYVCTHIYIYRERGQMCV